MICTKYFPWTWFKVRINNCLEIFYNVKEPWMAFSGRLKCTSFLIPCSSMEVIPNLCIYILHWINFSRISGRRKRERSKWQDAHLNVLDCNHSREIQKVRVNNNITEQFWNDLYHQFFTYCWKRMQEEGETTYRLFHAGSSGLRKLYLSI